MLRNQKMLFHNILYAIIAREEELIYLNPTQNPQFYHRGAVETGGHRAHVNVMLPGCGARSSSRRRRHRCCRVSDNNVSENSFRGFLQI